MITGRTDCPVYLGGRWDNKVSEVRCQGILGRGRQQSHGMSKNPRFLLATFVYEKTDKTM